MEYSLKGFLSEILNMLRDVDYIKSDDVPNIDLYMDQVTTFMDEQLYGCKRYEDDKILTKTMINNYAKNNLLPSPEKKKYSKEHMLVLLFIYYFKNILSISDIQSILNPITDRFFGNEDGFNMVDVYDEIFNQEKGEADKFLKEMAKKYQIAQKSYADFPEEDRANLQTFAFICELSFDVYLKKMLIERIIDGINKENGKSGGDSDDTDKSKSAGKDKPKAPVKDRDIAKGVAKEQAAEKAAAKAAAAAEKAAVKAAKTTKKSASSAGRRTSPA